MNSAAGTLTAGDVFLDQSTTDNDTVNITLNSAAIGAPVAATFANVENVNVTLDAFDGDGAGAGAGDGFDAANVSGATITLGSTKLGYNGAAAVLNAKANKVVAGTNVTDLAVTGLTTGSVDAGAADTVAVTTAAATNAANVTVNGDIDLTVATSKVVNLTATAASVVSVTAGGLVAASKITNTGDITLKGDADDLTAQEISGGSVDVSAATTGALDAEKYTVDAITVSTDVALAISNANGQTVNLTKANANLTVSGDATAGASVTVNVSADQVTGTGLVVDGVDTSSINLSSAVAEVASLTIEGDATVDVAGDVTIAALIATNATDTLTITGAGDVDLTASTLDVESVDSTGLTGGLTFAQAAAAAITVTTGAGDDSITLANTTQDAAVSTGNGTNTIDATALTSGTLSVEGGEGNETVKLGATFDAATVAMVGGAGTDTVLVANGADLSGAATWAVQGFEVLAVQDAAAGAVVAQSATLAGSQAAGFTSVKILAPTTGTSDDTLALTVDADETTTDLSGVVLASTTKITVAINGQDGVDDIIKGTNGNDTIDAGTGKDTLTGGAGADTFVFAAGDSSATVVDSITDFSIAQFDVLDFGATYAVAGDTAASVDVKSVVTGATELTADVVDGILTVSGADAAAIDTLTEWLDVALLADTDGTAETMAFVFGEDTYVVGISDTNAVDNVIKLAGVTDLAALDTAAGVNTLVIA